MTDTSIIIPERLAALDSLTIEKGSHPSFDDGACSMEIVAWLAGLGHTAAPKCASRVLTAFTINLNDSWDTEQRQKIKPYLPRMVGTRDDGLDVARSYLALDWLIRTHTPTWLDLAGLTVEAQELRDLRRIVDLVAAQAAGPVVRNASTKASAAWDAAGDAAWAAAGDAAGVAAWDAAGVAAWDAAGDAAWAAAWDAAGVAAGDAAGDAAWAAAGDAAGVAAWVAAGDAAGVAAWDAAGVAAWDALKPTVETLQAYALDLLDRMIDPSAVTS
jgi:hypothetical protein